MDVAAYFTQGIDVPQAANRTFELGGPDQVTWNELYVRIARVLGKRRRLVHVPWSVARAGARLTERLPGAPLTTDQISGLRPSQVSAFSTAEFSAVSTEQIARLSASDRK